MIFGSINFLNKNNIKAPYGAFLHLEQNYKIAIIGLGYVGLPLAFSFGKHYTTIGYDINIDTVNHLNSKFNKEIKFIFTNNKNDISIANIYIVTVIGQFMIIIYLNQQHQ